MPEGLERSVFWNEGSQNFVGEWIVQPPIPDEIVAASTTNQIDFDDFMQAGFIYLIEITTSSPAYQFKIWNNAARSGSPLRHLTLTDNLVNYRRMTTYLDEDGLKQLHFDIINDDTVQQSFSFLLKAFRQI